MAADAAGLKEEKGGVPGNCEVEEPMGREEDADCSTLTLKEEANGGRVEKGGDERGPNEGLEDWVRYWGVMRDWRPLPGDKRGERGGRVEASRTSGEPPEVERQEGSCRTRRMLDRSD